MEKTENISKYGSRIFESRTPQFDQIFHDVSVRRTRSNSFKGLRRRILSIGRLEKPKNQHLRIFGLIEGKSNELLRRHIQGNLKTIDELNENNESPLMVALRVRNYIATEILLKSGSQITIAQKPNIMKNSLSCDDEIVTKMIFERVYFGKTDSEFDPMDYDEHALDFMALHLEICRNCGIFRFFYSDVLQQLVWQKRKLNEHAEDTKTFVANTEKLFDLSKTMYHQLLLVICNIDDEEEIGEEKGEKMEDYGEESKNNIERFWERVSKMSIMYDELVNHIHSLYSTYETLNYTFETKNEYILTSSIYHEKSVMSIFNEICSLGTKFHVIVQKSYRNMNNGIYVIKSKPNSRLNTSEEEEESGNEIEDEEGEEEGIHDDKPEKKEEKVIEDDNNNTTDDRVEEKEEEDIFEPKSIESSSEEEEDDDEDEDDDDDDDDEDDEMDEMFKMHQKQQRERRESRNKLKKKRKDERKKLLLLARKKVEEEKKKEEEEKRKKLEEEERYKKIEEEEEEERKRKLEEEEERKNKLEEEKEKLEEEEEERKKKKEKEESGENSVCQEKKEEVIITEATTTQETREQEELEQIENINEEIENEIDGIEIQNEEKISYDELSQTSEPEPTTNNLEKEEDVKQQQQLEAITYTSEIQSQQHQFLTVPLTFGADLTLNNNDNFVRKKKNDELMKKIIEVFRKHKILIRRMKVKGANKITKKRFVKKMKIFCNFDSNNNNSEKKNKNKKSKNKKKSSQSSQKNNFEKNKQIVIKLINDLERRADNDLVYHIPSRTCRNISLEELDQPQRNTGQYKIEIYIFKKTFVLVNHFFQQKNKKSAKKKKNTEWNCFTMNVDLKISFLLFQNRFQMIIKEKRKEETEDDSSSNNNSDDGSENKKKKRRNRSRRTSRTSRLLEDEKRDTDFVVNEKHLVAVKFKNTEELKILRKIIDIVDLTQI